MIQKKKIIYLISLGLVSAVFILSSCGKTLKTTSKVELSPVEAFKAGPSLEVKSEHKLEIKQVEDVFKSVSKEGEMAIKVKESVTEPLKLFKSKDVEGLEKTGQKKSEKNNLGKKSDSGAGVKHAVKTSYIKPKTGFKFSFTREQIGLWKNPWRTSAGLLSVRF